MMEHDEFAKSTMESRTHVKYGEPIRAVLDEVLVVYGTEMTLRELLYQVSAYSREIIGNRRGFATEMSMVKDYERRYLNGDFD